MRGNSQSQGLIASLSVPADLTFSIENHPNHALQTVDACVEYVAKALEGTTTAVCFRNGSPSTRQKYADLGVTVFLE